MPANPPEDAPGSRTKVPPPPSKEEVDQISREQALITDEWAPVPPPSRGTPGGPAAG